MKQPATFLYVVRGLFAVPKLARRIDPVREGEVDSGWIFAFHVIPLHRHTIEVLAVDETTKTIRTHEHGGVVTTWNHTLHVEPLDSRRCLYSDAVEIGAGPLTGLVARAAVGIYRYRHRRWKRLARRLASA